MVRFGRGFPVPRQTFMVNPVSSIKEVVVYLSPISDPSAGIHYMNLVAGDLDFFTSEEVVVEILGLGIGLTAGDVGTGAVDGAGSISADIGGFGLGQVGQGAITLTGDVWDFGAWRNPSGRIPRRRWKKSKPFRDFYYEPGVEFIVAIVDTQDYGAWFYIVDEDSSPTILRSEADISSDYSIEGRP
jgi:hypothetical protein